MGNIVAKDELLITLTKINKTLDDIDYLAIKLNSIEVTDISQFDRLDTRYYNSYGGQEVFGIVVFKDSSWLERGEYDGAEWWEYKKTPTKEEVEQILLKD